MESNSSREFILTSEFFFESGRLSIAPAGSRVGVGFRDDWASASGRSQRAQSRSGRRGGASRPSGLANVPRCQILPSGIADPPLRPRWQVRKGGLPPLLLLRPLVFILCL